MPSGAAPVERMQLVTFRLGEEVFAADILAVERVLRYIAPRPIPNVPAWLDGVMDYGGRVVPVIDLRSRFELPAATSREAARILVFVVERDEYVAAIVDNVDDVATVPAERFAPPPSIFRGLAKPYVRALIRPATEGQPVMVLLDMARLLSSRERIVLEQAVQGASRRD